MIFKNTVNLSAPCSGWIRFRVWVTLCCLALSTLAWAAPQQTWWSEKATAALATAGTNANQITLALTKAPRDQRPGLQFLVENMPQSDLQSLSAAFLLENLELAYETRRSSAWAKAVPEEIFLNDVLPYASINERRDSWRKSFRAMCLPLVQDCRSTGEAAQRLNEKLFGLVKVRYSTGRKKADQSPLESMESGLASCTGLSILLVDACRSVGIPARLAGTPLWANKRGNHTWVEVWDQRWHFTGAAEPDPNGLDRGWFVQDASQAMKEVREHAIYATSFRKTGLSFPMVWAANLATVNAVNVTDSYAPPTKQVNPDQVRLSIKVVDRAQGRRTAANITVVEAKGGKIIQEGRSRDESADSNDFLSFVLPKKQAYRVQVASPNKDISQDFIPTDQAETLITLYLEPTQGVATLSPVCYSPPSILRPLRSTDESKLKKALNAYFEATIEKQKTWKFPAQLDRVLSDNEPAVRQAAWSAYRSAAIHQSAHQDFGSNIVRFAQHLSPYVVKTVGTRPSAGWPLFIAMHGGGGAPQELNDSQWRMMQNYYKDHPELGGYQYLALRAPNNSWNGFYDVYVYPLIENLIRQFALFGDVDVNKVFIMGYSHGGYGAFAIGPKIPYRFAAIHASAAAPTDGETTAKTLRNTRFSFMIGGKDTMYGRADRCQAFDASVKQLRGTRDDIYPVTLQWIANHGHSGLPDRDKITEMYSAVRNPVPHELTWAMTDDVVKSFFWLQSSLPKKGMEIQASCQDNRITLEGSALEGTNIYLDERLIDFRRPVVIQSGGKQHSYKLKPSLRTLCQSLQERGDPELAFTAMLEYPPSPNAKKNRGERF